MVELLTKKETDDRNPLYAWLRRGIFVGVSNFDQVVKLTKTSGKQFYNNLDAITNDRHNFFRITERFEFTDEDKKAFIQPKIKDFT